MPYSVTWTVLMDEKITIECIDKKCTDVHTIKKEGKPAHVYHIMIAKKEMEKDEESKS